MKLTGMHIWIISPEPWGVQLLSKHHYALELAHRNNDIVFIQAGGKHGEVETLSSHSKITLISWQSVRGLRKLPRSISKVLQRKEMIKIAELTGGQPDLIWSFDNSRFFDMDAWKTAATMIHHLVDLNQDYELARTAKSAHICFGTTQFILSKLTAHNSNSFNIGHGCSPVSRSVWKAHTNKPKVFYVGNLLIPLLNRKLILDAVRKFPDVEFHFIGAHEKSNVTRKVDGSAAAFVEELKSHPNAFLRGAMQREAYHAALNEADLFIIAYKKAFYEQVANPHKVLELLSTGRAILSNSLAEYEALPFIEMVDDAEIWLTVLEQMISKIDQWNTIELQEARINWALEHSYSKQVDQIEDLLND